MALLTRLNITKCIVIGDARRLENGKDPVRNMRGLSLQLEAVDEDLYSAEKIYRVLDRSRKVGLRKIDDKLLKDIQDILQVEEKELVKYGQV